MDQFHTNIYQTEDGMYHFMGELFSGINISEYADPTSYTTEAEAKDALERFCKEKGCRLQMK